ncbi:MAG: hypothetical protein C4K60_03635 [Ideonella sp. MAG2]|nr:MAG: hypothetical protein C4K60_03635 [Ideonella sp. MAG2]
MKKSIVALAVLGAFAGAASAQSSVTIYGKLNVELGKTIGSADKALLDTAGSRLGFRGVEDLGGGLNATFGIEHRFTPSSGAANANFWNGYSTVGLQGGFGWLRLGRDYTPAFLMIQNQIDPFGGDTVANLRDVGMRVAGSNITTVRNKNMVEYHLSASGFNLGAQIAEALPNGGPKRPYSLAANYAAGPLFVGAGVENPAGTNDNLWSIGARYNFGAATLSAGFSKGTTQADADAKGYLVGLAVPIGAGELKAGLAQAKVGSVTTSSKFGVGYHYNLSKRTKVFGDFARDSKAATEKTGYDVGIQHNF